MKDNEVPLRPRKCLDGKIRMKPLQGYDCIHHKWHNTPYLWSECANNYTQYHKDCNYSRNPLDCPDFVEKMRNERRGLT